MADPNRFEFLLRLGDSDLVLAQRLSEWVGKGPILEEDIALANVGLDLLGQARMWLTYAGEVEGAGRDEDALAYRRDTHQFRNALLCEQPNGNYADTTARQFLYDHWHVSMLRALERSSDERIAAIAAKAAKEVAYHVERSTDWVIRLGDGTDESHERMQAAIDASWPYAGELFVADAVDDAMARDGVAPDLATLAAPWRAAVTDALAEATLVVPSDDWAQRGGRQGRHTEHLGHLLTEMQFLQRAYPDAQW
ncbi:MAG TPA: 1,2-phenylacetyl-CoA epoxidase subunit PaaC [Casimicrobiaceae bacterium]